MSQASNGHRVLSGDLLPTAEQIISRYPNKRSAITPLLYLVQSIQGYVTEEGMREIGELLGLTPAEVLATASFYTMLKQRPQGEYLISVCRNVSCTHLGSRRVIQALENRLGVEVGETTPDGKFELEAAECLATCDGAPSIQINYEDFYRVSAEDASSLVDRLERGEEVRSVRGEAIKTSKEISHEAAVASLSVPGTAGDTQERTVGGEVPAPDTAPGFRPDVQGEEGGGGE